MSGISSGVGLISGINTSQVIEQLLAIEARPKQLAQKQVALLTSQQVAFQAINAKLLVLKLSAGTFSTGKTFQATSATSSNEDVLTASTSSAATPGTYSFTVSKLVSSQQLVTKGFADKGASAVAPSGGTLTFEFGDAKLSTNTSLAQLNGGAGVTRGKIRITDRSGASAVVDLSRALTVNDVLEAINGASGINVTATAGKNGLVLKDNTGATTANLQVAEVSGGTTAASLGLSVAAVAGTLTGSQINSVGRSTSLASLNDGNGVRYVGALDDFSITHSAGTFNVNLNNVSSLGEVIDAINNASGGAVTAAVGSDGASLKLTDNGSPTSTVSVAALNNSKAAKDLGILGTGTAGSGVLQGGRVIAGLNSRLISNLNGGSGATLGTIRITNRAGASADVDLSSASSVQDILDAINASGISVTASLNGAGNGLKLTDSTGSTASNLIVADVSGTAAANLKIAGSVAATTLGSGNLQLRYLSEATKLTQLNGGKGIAQGKFTLTDSSGASATVDLSQGNEVSLQDVITEINSRGLAVNARINDNGDGLLIEDTGPGTSKLKIEESGSTTAKDLGILGEATNAGDDINGSFEKTVTLDNDDTLDDVATKIRDAKLGVGASIISDGSALTPFRLSLLSNSSGRAGAFVFDDGGLDLGATALSEAQDAVVFYGSTDPAKAIALSSSTNTLNAVIPGVTVSLKSTSTTAVTLTVSRDDAAVVSGAKKFVDDFNALIDTLKTYDFYDSEKEQKGLLLGDATVSRVRDGLFRKVIGRTTELTSRYTSLSQVGITVGEGSKLQFDEAKFRKALDTDFTAVRNLFDFKETTTDSETKVTTITKGGILVRIEELLGNYTDSVDGTLQSRLDTLGKQIDQNKDRVTQFDAALERKRKVLESQFAAMEKVLAQLQSQSSSLSQLGSLAASTQAAG